MQISNERLEAFTDVWRKAFEEELEREQAHVFATQILDFARRVRRPIPMAGTQSLDDLGACSDVEEGVA